MYFFPCVVTSELVARTMISFFSFILFTLQHFSDIVYPCWLHNKHCSVVCSAKESFRLCDAANHSAPLFQFSSILEGLHASVWVLDEIACIVYGWWCWAALVCVDSNSLTYIKWSWFQNQWKMMQFFHAWLVMYKKNIWSSTGNRLSRRVQFAFESKFDFFTFWLFFLFIIFCFIFIISLKFGYSTEL